MMTDTAHAESPPPNPWYCPECGASNFASRTKCYLCGREITEAERTSVPPPSQLRPSASDRVDLSAASHDRHGPATYTLSTLMLFVTLACVFCGLTAAAPGLGIPLAVLITPALIRALAVSRVKRSQGIQSTVADKIGAFFSSFALMILVSIAAGAAFFAACSAVCLSAQGSRGGSSDFQAFWAMGLGGLAALGVGVWILSRTWPKK